MKKALSKKNAVESLIVEGLNIVIFALPRKYLPFPSIIELSIAMIYEKYLRRLC